MNEPNKHAEYWETVAGIAAEAKEAEKRGEDPRDFMHESVDGAYHVIYTHANLDCLQASRNESAVFDDMGDDALAGCKSYGEVMMRLAFYAMLADVEEEFAALPEEEAADADEVQP